MFDLFTHVYAMERKANGEPVWISPEKDPEGMEAARERAKAQPIDGERYAYFVRAEENPHLTFLDYDTKNGKRGAEQYVIIDPIHKCDLCDNPAEWSYWLPWDDSIQPACAECSQWAGEQFWKIMIPATKGGGDHGKGQLD